MSITAEQAAKILSGTGPPIVFDPSRNIAEEALIVEMKEAASIADLIRTQAARIAELELNVKAYEARIRTMADSLGIEPNNLQEHQR